MTAAAMFKALSLSKDHQQHFQAVLDALVVKGELQIKKKTYSLPSSNRVTCEGVLRLHPRGFGFVKVEHQEEEVFIPKHLTEGAIDGDIVEIEQLGTSSKGPEGKVVKIVSRGRTHLGGIVVSTSSKGMLKVYCPLLGPTKPVSVKSSKKFRVGDRVILKILTWGDEEDSPTGEVSHLFGHISDPSIDNLAAIEDYNLRNSFPPKAVKEAKDYGTSVSEKDLKNREDFTHIQTVTIDPETAKDFDDALSLSKDDKGHFHLKVHIADVAHYVPAGSSLDEEAKQRCNSTYFPGFCLPMLPHELSDHLCSLRPKVVRLTVSVLMEFDTQGSLVGYKIKRSAIKSNKRFSYEEAKAVLEGTIKSPFKPLLELMVELCLLLKKKRSARGSIDFAMPEIVLVVDEKGVPQGTKKVEYDITHQMVEEFMLKANEVVASHLSKEGRPVLFRTHEEPSEENIEDFYTLARFMGFSLPKDPQAEDLQKLFDLAKKTPFAQQLSVAFIRSMKLANYSPENIGHYGLALENYCHFTSPIRRYSDLVIQRLLFHEEEKDLDVQQVAQACSEKERISFRAEMSVRALKKLRLLKTWMEEDPKRSYNAYVTRVKPFGLTFEIPELGLEGFIHVSELENDYFIYNEKTQTLLGRRTHQKYEVGSFIHVVPTSIDLILLESKWKSS